MKINNNRGDVLAVDYIPAKQSKGNVIFCCTPVVPVTEFRKCYQPIAHGGYDVYAFDFAGIGDSGGDIRKLSIKGICDDFDSIAAYIAAQNNNPIFLFGDTGTGGIIAQYYASATDRLRGFAQFGSAIYKDASPLGMSKTALAFVYPIVCLLAKISPGTTIKFSAPAYNGYHADMDNDFYTDALLRYPNFFNMAISLLKTVLDILCAPDSAIQRDMKIPTLVFKTKHDRYFSESYFDQYYGGLICPKKLIEIDDVHNSYYFYPDDFAAHVINWFDKYIK